MKKPKRKPKIMTNRYSIKDDALEASMNCKPGEKIQQNNPANIPWQEKEKEAYDTTEDGKPSIHEKFNTAQKCFLDRIPFSEKDDWMHLINAVNCNTNDGVVETTWKTRQHYWWHWIDFLPSSFDPYLQNVDAMQWLVVLQAFARWERERAFGRGKQVQTRSVQAAIGAIARTIKLAGQPNPLHKPGMTNYHAALTIQMEGYRRGDPATDKQIAVPVRVPNFIFTNSKETKDPQQRAVSKLVLIAFYFLLHVGEYTCHSTK